MTGKKFNFIVIDDSELDCFIAAKMIKHTGKCGTIKCFSVATEALKHIAGAEDGQDQVETIVLLDVLMPVMSGFAFVEAFESLAEDIRARHHIIALTSSMNKNDIEKIAAYESVKNVLDKPITTEALSALLEA